MHFFAGVSLVAALASSLNALPQMGLFDSPVHIVAHAEPRSTVTLEATARIDGNRYHSWASYRADQRGVIDVSRDAPLQGSYAGHAPMGLFWSMSPQGSSVYSRPSLDPIDVALTLHARVGVAHATIRRLRISPDVIREPIRDAPFVGTLFTHRSAKARAIVVVLAGSEGGMDENRAAIIASHDFDTLALAYFGMGPLPRELANIPLEYVNDALTWLQSQPTLATLPVVLEGDSKGAELALLIAAHNPAVKGVVAFAPSSQMFEGLSTHDGKQRASWTWRGDPLPFANNPVPPSVKAAIRAQRAAHEPISYRNQYVALASPPEDATTIPVESIRGPVLLLAGADDQLWPSDIFAQRIMARRRSHGTLFNDELLLYSRAGHQIDVPYTPTTGLSVFNEGNFLLALGGTPSGYATADADMWPRVLAFLQRVTTQSIR